MAIPGTLWRLRHYAEADKKRKIQKTDNQEAWRS
jgi:hypothetical protein